MVDGGGLPGAHKWLISSVGMGASGCSVQRGPFARAVCVVALAEATKRAYLPGRGLGLWRRTRGVGGLATIPCHPGVSMTYARWAEASTRLPLGGVGACGVVKKRRSRYFG